MPSRVLIVRTSALGDVVHTLPLATALRRHLPTARIGWLVERRYAPLLVDHPAIDEVIEVKLKDWRRRPLARRTWREARDFAGRLQAFAPDLVIDAMGNHKSGALAALTLADLRLGARREDRREPSSALWISQPVALAGEHVVDRTLSLLAGLGLPPGEADFGGDGVLPGAVARAGAPQVLIHPGAGWRNKEYPAERWGRAAAAIHGATGVDVGVLAGPGEEALADAVLAAAGIGRRVAAPTLEALAGLLRGTRLLLAGDTGPLHLAHALGTRVLCVLGPTDPRRNGAYGAPLANLAHRLPCSYCYKRFDEAKACLLTIEPHRVAALAGRLLAGV
jgi:lipopolysaccharide heptosyltransferase I